MLIPRLAITDTDDAQTVFNALNAYYARDYERMSVDERTRTIDLLIATHAEMNRETADNDC
jgi:hypothetical protein